MRVVFVDENGDEYRPEEVRRLFKESGFDPAVTLVRDDELRAGDQAAMIRHLFGPPESWRTGTRLLFTPEGPVLEEHPAAGRWRLFLPRPGAAPLFTEAVDIQGEEIPVRVVLPRSLETRPFYIVDGETGDAVAGATVTPYFEYGDDAAFFRGPPIASDASGYVEIPMLGPLDQNRRREPSWWAEKDGRLGRIIVNRLLPGTDARRIPLYCPATVIGRAATRRRPGGPTRTAGTGSRISSPGRST